MHTHLKKARHHAEKLMGVIEKLHHAEGKAMKKMVHKVDDRHERRDTHKKEKEKKHERKDRY